MAEVFAAGAISYRLVAAVVVRTRLVEDPRRDGQNRYRNRRRTSPGWGSLLVEKNQTEIDYWVDRMTPRRYAGPKTAGARALCRCPQTDDGSGTADIQAQLLATDAEAWINASRRWPRAACDNDPRTLEQRRADVLGALGHGADRHTHAAAKTPNVAAAGTQPYAVVVHVVTNEDIPVR